MTADDHAQLPDTWLTVSGDRVEILVTTDRVSRRFYWHMRSASDGHVIDSDGRPYRHRRGAAHAAMRRHPMVEAA